MPQTHYPIKFNQLFEAEVGARTFPALAISLAVYRTNNERNRATIQV
jgi:hypothetical protein